MKHTLFTISTLLNLKKFKRFLNITEYKLFLIKSFLYRYLYPNIDIQIGLGTLEEKKFWRTGVTGDFMKKVLAATCALKDR